MPSLSPRARQVRTAMIGAPAALSRWVSIRYGAETRVRSDLAELSDRTLSDIGLSRTVSLHVSWPQRTSLAAHG